MNRTVSGPENIKQRVADVRARLAAHPEVCLCEFDADLRWLLDSLDAVRPLVEEDESGYAEQRETCLRHAVTLDRKLTRRGAVHLTRSDASAIRSALVSSSSLWNNMAREAREANNG